MEHLNYDQLWQSKFTSEVICLCYDLKLKLLAAGCDNGFIRILSVDANKPNTRIIKYDNKVHKGRVMGIRMHHKSGMMISIGEDKFLRVFSLNSLGMLSGNSGLILFRLYRWGGEVDLFGNFEKWRYSFCGR
jgi:WD40 repeat protein